MLKFRNTAALLAVLTVLALPAPADAQRVREDTARRGWIGVRPWFSITVINGKRTERMSIADVVEDSPADRAGVRRGDRVLRINGRDANESALSELSRGLEPGDTVRLRLASGERGRERDVTIIAAEQPHNVFAMTRVRAAIPPHDSVLNMARVFMDSAMRVLRDTTFFFRLDKDGPQGFMFPNDSFSVRIFRHPDAMFGEPDIQFFRFRSGDDFEFPDIAFFGERSVSGAEFTQLNEGLSEYFGTGEGLLVLKVAPGTPADRAGLEPGDVVTRANGRDVGSVMDLRKEVMNARGEPVRLEILRKGQKRTLNL